MWHDNYFIFPLLYYSTSKMLSVTLSLGNTCVTGNPDRTCVCGGLCAFFHVNPALFTPELRYFRKPSNATCDSFATPVQLRPLKVPHHCCENTNSHSAPRACTRPSLRPWQPKARWELESPLRVAHFPQVSRDLHRRVGGVWQHFSARRTEPYWYAICVKVMTICSEDRIKALTRSCCRCLLPDTRDTDERM